MGKGSNILDLGGIVSLTRDAAIVYMLNMASLQQYSSRGHRYYRIVESYRRNGRPHIRVVEHLGRADEVLARLRGADRPVQYRSVAAGAVTALYRRAEQLDIAGEIDGAITRHTTRRGPKRDGLSVGQSLVLAAIQRVSAPGSKRAFAAWAGTTALPDLGGFVAEALTSQHFWDQMHAVPVAAIAEIEAAVVQRAVRTDQLAVAAVAYDTSNFYTYLATTNTRSQLAQRGHNKQGRHDLRQLGLALVVSEDEEVPLGHVLYEGARPDVRTFADVIAPLRRRLRALTGGPEQLTLVFDNGAVSTANLATLHQEGTCYVAALKPSEHKAWLAAVASQLTEVPMPGAEPVRAYRTLRAVAGREQTVVVMFSPKLQAGQLRGLQQAMSKALQRCAALTRAPRGEAATLAAKLRRVWARQYLRDLVHVEVTQAAGGPPVATLGCDPAEYTRLTQQYFGLRILGTDRHEWSTGQIIAAYRGQAKVEHAFRDLKNPAYLALRPQFHWTDQKLRVHALICLLGFLVARLLWRRARRLLGFPGNCASLLATLATIRSGVAVEVTGKAGRPRVRPYVEDMEPPVRRLAETLNALPGV